MPKKKRVKENSAFHVWVLQRPVTITVSYAATSTWSNQFGSWLISNGRMTEFCHWKPPATEIRGWYCPLLPTPTARPTTYQLTYIKLSSSFSEFGGKLSVPVSVSSASFMLHRRWELRVHLQAYSMGVLQEQYEVFSCSNWKHFIPWICQKQCVLSLPWCWHNIKYMRWIN